MAKSDPNADEKSLKEKIQKQRAAEGSTDECSKVRSLRKRLKRLQRRRRALAARLRRAEGKKKAAEAKTS
jgi:hypothetical protein